jgi:hypothetical protein
MYSQVSIVDGPQMFVVSPDKVYIVDKVEGNAYQINGHSLYSVVWCATLCFMYHRLKRETGT